MRLGQLARKLALSTTEIVSFLAEKDIEIKDHPNIKLDEATEEMVLSTFGETVSKEPETVQSITNTEQAEQESKPSTSLSETVDSLELESNVPDDSTDSTVLNKNEAETESVNEEINEQSSDQVEISETEEEEDIIEVIKAPKIELPGLKVVGKIDLPEPKVKETEIEEIKDTIESKEETESKNTEDVNYVFHNRRNARPRLTEEEREARRLKQKKAKEMRKKQDEERRAKAEENRIKAKREKHYKKKLEQAAVSTKSVSSKKPRKIEGPVQRESAKPKPKTIMGKFWRWLNT